MSDPTSDDELLAGLARALHRTDPVPDDVIVGARAAYLARNLDQELAELVFDSASDREVVLTRGAPTRSLSFATGELGIELELHNDPRRIVGQLVPPQRVAVDLEFEGLVVDAVTTDDLGRFRFDDVPAGAVAIVCRASGDTPWQVCTVSFEI